METLFYDRIIVKYLFEISKAFIVSGIASPFLTTAQAGLLEKIAAVCVATVFSLIFVIMAVKLQKGLDDK